MSNMSGWLDRKYSNLEAQTRNQGVASEAQARASDVASSLAPGEAAARNAAEFGQAAQSRAQAGVMDANRAWVAPLATSEIGQRQAQTGELGAQTRALNAEQQFIPGFDPSSLLPHFAGWNEVPGNYKSGAARIPGKGDGRTDTQPAVLAPGEAVLNKAAAEHLGRDTIELLNALGAHKMGIDAAAASQQQTSDQPAAPGYAGGTSDVMSHADFLRQPPPVPSWTGGGAIPMNTAPTPVAAPLSVGGTPSFSGTSAQRAYEGGFRSAAGQGGGGGAGGGGIAQTAEDRNRVGVVRAGAPGFAKGTAKVPAKGSAKGPAKGAPAQAAPPMPQPGPAAGGEGGRGGLNAHVLAALAQMGGGGGGMPAPGAAPPMPMPMPQVGARRAAA